MKLNRLLVLASSISVLVIALSIAYYFLIFLPQQVQRQDLTGQLNAQQINWDAKWRQFLQNSQVTKQKATEECASEILQAWDEKHRVRYLKGLNGNSDQEIDSFLAQRYQALERNMNRCLKRKSMGSWFYLSSRSL